MAAEKRYTCEVCLASVPGESAREAHEASEAHMEAATAPPLPPATPDPDPEPVGEQPPPAPEPPDPDDALPADDPAPDPSPVAQAPAPEPAVAPVSGIMCEVEGCGGGPFTSFQQVKDHQAGDAHRLLRRAVVHADEGARRAAIKARAQEAGLGDDLLFYVLGFEMTPQQRAKGVRGCFKMRGWPDDDHLGAVLDFLIEWDIPYTVTSRPALKPAPPKR